MNPIEAEGSGRRPSPCWSATCSKRGAARRVEAGTAIDNLAMRRVLERLGLVEEGILRSWYPSEDGGVDCVMYGMTRTDYQNQEDRWTRTS
jgi:RimJ/RimL family protein N-acetyltransferase